MIRRETVQTDGLSQSVLTAGDGPLVLLVHGFPELAISWTAQIEALAAAGYRVVAPDMRGYGASALTEGAPTRTEDFSIFHLVGDLVDLVRALGEREAVIVGHDWGASVAWSAALMRPDLFRAVAGLSVPFQPRTVAGPPTRLMREASAKLGLGELYIVSFQNVVAYGPFDLDPETALRKCFWSFDGATPRDRQSTGFLPTGKPMLETISDEASLPPWMSPEHFADYVAAFTASGFKRPLDWYRNIDRNWELTAHLQGKTVEQPSLFIVGENDPVRHYAGRHEKGLPDWLRDLRGQMVIPGAGHWIQQERPDAVNAALLGFLAGLT